MQRRRAADLAPGLLGFAQQIGRIQSGAISALAKGSSFSSQCFFREVVARLAAADQHSFHAGPRIRAESGEELDPDRLSTGERARQVQRREKSESAYPEIHSGVG